MNVTIGILRNFIRSLVFFKRIITSCIFYNFFFLFFFADAFGGASVESNGNNIVAKKQQSLVHIRNQQRNGRKSITTMIGFASDLDLLKILKCMRKVRLTLEIGFFSLICHFPFLIK